MDFLPQYMNCDVWGWLMTPERIVGGAGLAVALNLKAGVMPLAARRLPKCSRA